LTKLEHTAGDAKQIERQNACRRGSASIRHLNHARQGPVVLDARNGLPPAIAVATNPTGTRFGATFEGKARDGIVSSVGNPHAGHPGISSPSDFMWCRGELVDLRQLVRAAATWVMHL
jgi:hypothetical protein